MAWMLPTKLGEQISRSGTVKQARRFHATYIDGGIGTEGITARDS